MPVCVSVNLAYHSRLDVSASPEVLLNLNLSSHLLLDPSRDDLLFVQALERDDEMRSRLGPSEVDPSEFPFPEGSPDRESGQGQRDGPSGYQLGGSASDTMTD
mgnify:CR=1 FL=1